MAGPITTLAALIWLAMSVLVLTDQYEPSRLTIALGFLGTSLLLRGLA